MCDTSALLLPCQFPAHSHWRLEDGKLHINWGKYGKYELALDEDGQNMAGSAEGDPSNWRKATRLRTIAGAYAECDHSDHNH